MASFPGEWKENFMNGYLTMKELPLTEQPYEKCETYGAEFLSDAELLAILLRSGTANIRSTEVAFRILNFHKDNCGLYGLQHMSQKELMSIPGVGRIKAIQLLSIVELCTRMAKATKEKLVHLSDPQSVAAYYMQQMRTKKTEQARVLFFDTKSHLIGDKVVSSGTVNASIMSPREIYIAALEYEAVHIILLHNHPSGDPAPSREDILVTKRMQEAGNFIGITLLDHIIIGDNRYISLKEQGLF